jgi:hypothetical protein
MLQHYLEALARNPAAVFLFPVIAVGGVIAALVVCVIYRLATK